MLQDQVLQYTTLEISECAFLAHLRDDGKQHSWLGPHSGCQRTCMRLSHRHGSRCRSFRIIGISSTFKIVFVPHGLTLGSLMRVHLVIRLHWPLRLRVCNTRRFIHILHLAASIRLVNIQVASSLVWVFGWWSLFFMHLLLLKGRKLLWCLLKALILLV